MKRRGWAVLWLAAAVAAGPGAGAAAADAPQRAAWWNALSAPGLTAPQPTTAEGDLHVAQAPGRALAFAALQYANDEASAVRLSLRLRADRVHGTPSVVACPATSIAWHAGGNQPADAAPEFDCADPAQGGLTEDGAAMVLALDRRHQSEPGVWSVVLIAPPGTQAPFSVDFADPGQDTFQPEGAEPPVSVVDQPPGDVGATQPWGFAAIPPGDSPAATDQSAGPPAAAEAERSDTRIQRGVAPGSAVAAAAEAPRRLTSGGRLLALLTLFAGTALLGHSVQQDRQPQLLGGRARTLTVPLPDADLHPARHERPRGVGRFARERGGPPRGLR